MATKVKFKKRSKIEIDSIPIEDGSVIFSTDTPEIFVDNEDERITYDGSKKIDAYSKEESNEKFAVKEDIPETLPNPNALTFTGAVEETYDGSEPKTINIPSGGGSGTNNYNDLTNKPKINNIELSDNKSLEDLGIQPKGDYLTEVPKASEDSFGGVKAKAKTTETVEIAIDSSTGKLYAPTYPSISGGGTSNYQDLENKPSINDIELVGNKTLDELGIQKKGEYLTSIPEEYVTESELNEKGYVTSIELPDTLPNPYKLIFTGAVTGEYDGTSEKTINIPQGGESQNGIPSGGTTGQILAKKLELIMM